jgi:hypothetical protein
MSWNIEVEGGKSVRLPTAGKYCDQDIVVTAKGDDLAKQIVERKVTQIVDNGITKVGVYGVAYCSELTEVRLPECSGIETSGFTACRCLVIADFPKLLWISDQAFDWCSLLKNVNFPKVTTLGDFSFRGCSALERIDLPKATRIGNSTFFRCSSLTTVIIRNVTMVTLSNDTFKNTPIEDGTGYIYVPAALVDTYKADSNWSVYANQIRAIEDYTVDGTITGALDPTKTGN